MVSSDTKEEAFSGVSNVLLKTLLMQHFPQNFQI